MQGGMRINFKIPVFSKQTKYNMGIGQMYLNNWNQLFIITDKSTKNGKPLSHVLETDLHSNNLFSAYATNNPSALYRWLHGKYDNLVPVPTDLDELYYRSIINKSI